MIASWRGFLLKRNDLCNDPHSQRPWLLSFVVVMSHLGISISLVCFAHVLLRFVCKFSLLAAAN